MASLHDLATIHGQSPWIDNLRRDWLTEGTMADWIERGVRGCTSNPTIFQKAMTAGTAYDVQFGALLREGLAVEDVYWRLVHDDIDAALALFRPVHDATEGLDGHVSLELAPSLARDAAGSLEAARAFYARHPAPNLMVKVPGTAEGIDVVGVLVSEGRNVNVTLLFGLDRYEAVMEAYLSGLEAIDGDLSDVRGVASFFVSRVDTEVDRRLDTIGTDAALALRGRTAIAQARVAYQRFRARFAGPRWEALVARGAHVQRPLWASTSTKNPDYPPTYYVDALIGPDTVDTVPEATLEHFEQQGTLARTLDADPDAAQRVLDDVAAAGVDLDDVSRVLEGQGVDSFAASFDDLLADLKKKAAELT